MTKISVSYARCDWSVTMFISGYANTIVMSQHIPQSYFIKEIENVCRVYIIYIMQTQERVWSNLKAYLCVPSLTARVHINFQILPNSLLIVFASWNINMGDHFLFLKYIHFSFSSRGKKPTTNRSNNEYDRRLALFSVV